ncbi:hypothetical protein OO306_03875 [Pseudomonas sp. DCB_AW]|uniref:hypothetical protein n=1 Tax=Pseudomonas sp. DCB_AW TaxID=2993596 RepID=UPI002248DA51|nr:hypothetical protein [Pseudomonas sp. DCB_AW]MCX2684687.1 hypothetical protein [Pseudomonas sp. DCB_AW]
MKPQLIVMLTHNDLTVNNALELFEACKDLPIPFWGFKDVGIPDAAMRELIDAMKRAGKTTFLEVVTFDEESCLACAKMAVDYGFDYLTGTLFFPSVAEYLKDKPIRYYPFVGNVGGSPVKLVGSQQSILDDAARLEAAGVHGLDLVAYRYVDGDPVQLASELVANAKTEVIIAGSIQSEERLAIMKEINPFAFTMGGALFDKRFVADGDFRDNLARVVEIMHSL